MFTDPRLRTRPYPRAPRDEHRRRDGGGSDDVVLDEDAGVVQVDQDRLALKKAQRLEFPA